MHNHDHNHEARVFHNDKYGFLIHCPTCDRFQLGFGTFKLNQDREELQSFAQLINRYAYQYRKRLARTQRDIPINTPYPGFSLLFSVEDIDRLNKLLQHSLLVLQAEDPARLQ